MTSYTPQTQPCPHCDNGRVYARDYGCTATTCSECNGSGEIDCCCAECLTVTALNQDGLCERCNDKITLPLAAFEIKYLGDGYYRVAAE